MYILRNGGAYSPYYADLHLVVDWNKNGFQVKNRLNPETGKTYSNVSMLAKTEKDCFFCPGLTWSRRSQRGMSVRADGSASIFSDKGPVGFIDPKFLHTYLGIMNSRAFLNMISLQMAFGSYEVGVINRTPVPILKPDLVKKLDRLVKIMLGTKQVGDAFNELAHLFICPEMDGFYKSSLTEQAEISHYYWPSQEEIMLEWQAEIDQIVYELYGISETDRQTIEQGFGSGESEESTGENGEEETTAHHDASSLTSDLLSWLLGVTFGRWDVRYANRKKRPPEWPDPFAPLPVCPPGQLQNEDGLPITPADIDRLKQSGQWDYPIEIPWDGILVDDPGHRLDIEARLHQVLQIIWNDRWEAIEQEACEILDVKSLREYFRKPAGFFADHLKRYSKSRRQAPIYWPLSTTSGSYTLWVYYHRLTDQTLYTCVNDFIEPKLRQTGESLTVLRNATGRSKAGEKELESLQVLETELQEFRDELLRLAQLPWKPNLNDGVQITAAPLWKLFRLSKWQNILKETWAKLEKGEYDWAHLAYSIWPQRVAEKCKKDKSLAISHGVEAIYVEPEAKPKKVRRKKKQ